MSVTHRGALNVQLYRRAQLALLCKTRSAHTGRLEYMTPRLRGQEDPMDSVPGEFVPGVVAVGTDSGERTMEELRAVLRCERPKILARWGAMSGCVKAARGQASCIVWGCGQRTAPVKTALITHTCSGHYKVGPATRACACSVRYHVGYVWVPCRATCLWLLWLRVRQNV